MRSWLLSSALAAFFVFGCCGQKSTGSGEAQGGNAPGDSTTRREAPKHNAPDQDRIDSLKREKEKGKY
ncbi:MAG: hypothetical protein KA175_06825 [Flavobacteriales bacterium]|nr:hypothetical protein [Flavobacteriales bacterium]MBP6697313.1 hypothetical protein [Flavobacteriales bacterium]